MKVKALNAPPAEKAHEPGPLITVVEVGLEMPKIPEVQEGIVPASAGAKPLPDTVTTVPTGPELGLSMIVGEVLDTVNVA